MKQSEFAALGKLVDEADSKAEEWLQSESLSELRAALEKAIALLPDEYQVTLDVTLSIYDDKRERTIELVNHGWCFDNESPPYTASSASSPHQYLVDGEVRKLPHEYCPNCWAAWIFKFEQPICPTCGYVMGKQVMQLVDNDLCPFCEDGAITSTNPKCQKCGNQVNPAFIAW